MTRLLVYSTTLVAFMAATTMTVAAIFLPNWVSWEVGAGTSSHFYKTIGLHRSCISNNSCHHFPQYEDCAGPDRHFCSMWRTVGFLMSFAAVFEFATLLCMALIIAGGKNKREGGWKILAFMLGLVAIVQCASMTIVAYLFDNDDRFLVPGWRLDKGWILCTTSWSVTMICACFISLSAFIFPSEGGYELIPSERYGL